MPNPLLVPEYADKLTGRGRSQNTRNHSTYFVNLTKYGCPQNDDVRLLASVGPEIERGVDSPASVVQLTQH